jgi:HJR/Mrr/RecB family endonuclease
MRAASADLSASASSSLENEIKRLEDEITQLKTILSSIDAEMKRLETLRPQLKEEESKLYRRLREAEQRKADLEERISNLKEQRGSDYLAALALICLVIFWVGLFWAIGHTGHFEGDLLSGHWVPDYTGISASPLSLAIMLITLFSVNKSNKVRELQLKNLFVELNGEVGHINSLARELETISIDNKMRRSRDKINEITRRIALLQDRVRFLKEQDKKGLTIFVDRLGRERWGTPEQVKEWKKIDLGLSNNFADYSPRQFEVLMAELFSKMGYEVEIGKYAQDFGIDLVAKKDNETTVVEVKKWEAGKNVGAEVVRSVLGAIWKAKATRAVVVTTSDFTALAQEQAKGAPVQLWNINILKDLMEKYFMAKEREGE